MQAQHARWSDIMKVQKPDPTARANCPSGGYEFATVIWRYIRVLALAAKAEGLRVAGKEEEFTQTNQFLDTYLDHVRVKSCINLACHAFLVHMKDSISVRVQTPSCSIECMLVELMMTTKLLHRLFLHSADLSVVGHQLRLSSL